MTRHPQRVSSHGLITTAPHCILLHYVEHVEHVEHVGHNRSVADSFFFVSMTTENFLFVLVSVCLSLAFSQQHVNISQGFYQRASSSAPAGLPRRGGYRKS